MPPEGALQPSTESNQRDQTKNVLGMEPSTESVGYGWEQECRIEIKGSFIQTSKHRVSQELDPQKWTVSRCGWGEEVN